MNANKKIPPCSLDFLPGLRVHGSCLSHINIGIFDVQIFSDNKELIDIIIEATSFYVSRVVDEPQSSARVQTL